MRLDNVIFFIVLLYLAWDRHIGFVDIFRNMYFCVLQNRVLQKQSVKIVLKVLWKSFMEIIVFNNVMKFTL